MNIRKPLLLVLIIAIAALGLTLTGCDKKPEHPTGEHPTKETAAEAETLCTKCGQVAGSDACCKPGAEKCEKCGLDKGSPGCCKLEKVTEAAKACCSEDPSKCCASKTAEHPTGEHPQ